MRGEFDFEPQCATITDLVRAASIASAWRVFSAAMERRGFDMLIYCGSKLGAKGQVIGLEESLILLNGPDSYVETYLQEKLYQNSLTFEWASRHTGFVSWETALADFGVHPSPRQIELWSLHADLGVTAGVIGGLGDLVPGARGIIGMASSQGWTTEENDARWAAFGEDITLLCETMHLRMASLPQTGVLRPLTGRQVEVLYWYGEGKMVQDIALIMKISPGTVEKHMRMAREALEADTTAHAVRKAVSLNLLTA